MWTKITEHGFTSTYINLDNAFKIEHGSLWFIGSETDIAHKEMLLDPADAILSNAFDVRQHWVRVTPAPGSGVDPLHINLRHVVLLARGRHEPISTSVRFTLPFAEGDHAPKLWVLETPEQILGRS